MKKALFGVIFYACFIFEADEVKEVEGFAFRELRCFIQ